MNYPADEMFYRENAKSNCKKCEGLGMIMYCFDQDDRRCAPCPRCFPDDSWAKRMARRWASSSKYDDVNPFL